MQRIVMVLKYLHELIQGNVYGKLAPVYEVEQRAHAVRGDPHYLEGVEVPDVILAGDLDRELGSVLYLFNEIHFEYLSRSTP